MNNATHRSNQLHNDYGLHYTTHQPTYLYILEIFTFFIKLAHGTVLELISMISLITNHAHTRYKKNLVQLAFKIEELAFAHKMEFRKAFKYAAAVYVTVAIVTMTSGISISSYQDPVYRFPLMVAHHAPDHHAPDKIDVIVARNIETSSQKPAEEPAPKDDVEEPPFFAPILQASRTYNVDIALIRAIIMAESSNNPKAVSHMGAQGLMQLMPITAKSLGVDDAFDPALNIDGGVRYFRTLLDRFDGDVELALAAYNAGSRYVRKYGGVPPFKETRRYIRKVLKYRLKFQTESVPPSNQIAMR